MEKCPMFNTDQDQEVLYNNNPPWKERLRNTFSHALREKCPYSELFWSAFSRIRTEYGEIWSMERCGLE